MTLRQIPVLTIGLLTVLICLHWLVEDKTQLYFSAANIFQGETWRLVSGHFMHADSRHLLWNCLGLAVLGTLLEYRSRCVLLASLAVGITIVSVLLLTPWSHLNYYCGLSGVLNTLLLVALWFEWRLTRSWMITLMACGSLAKVLVEVYQGTSIMTHISWPPYAWSHVAGLIGGLFVIWMLARTKTVAPLRLSHGGCVTRYAPDHRRMLKPLVGNKLPTLRVRSG
jgi:rhomboid family GlyGly-CTERM serine protease